MMAVAPLAEAIDRAPAVRAGIVRVCARSRRRRGAGRAASRDDLVQADGGAAAGDAVDGADGPGDPVQVADVFRDDLREDAGVAGWWSAPRRLLAPPEWQGRSG